MAPEGPWANCTWVEEAGPLSLDDPDFAHLWWELRKLLIQHSITHFWHCSWEVLLTWCSWGLEQCFLKFSVHVSQLDVSFKCRFWFRNSQMGVKSCISNKLPSNDCPLTSLWVVSCRSISSIWSVLYWKVSPSLQKLFLNSVNCNIVLLVYVRVDRNTDSNSFPGLEKQLSTHTRVVMCLHFH